MCYVLSSRAGNGVDLLKMRLQGCIKKWHGSYFTHRDNTLMGYKVKQTFLSVFLKPYQQNITQAGMPVPPSICKTMCYLEIEPCAKG